MKKEPHQGIQHEIVNSGTKRKIVEVSQEGGWWGNHRRVSESNKQTEFLSSNILSLKMMGQCL